MVSIVTNELGKKITEQAGAARTLNIFGNDFNPFFDEPTFGLGANFPNRINAGDQTTVFAMNASPFPQPQHGGHEVVTCLTFVSNITGPGTGQIQHRWFNSDNTQVFQFTCNFSLGSGTHSVWCFSFLGWLHHADGTKELFENSIGGPTSTRVEIRVTGIISPSNPAFEDFTINFDVTDASPNPMTQGKGVDKRGFMWVDDSSNELMHVDGFGYVHNIGIPIESSVAAPGAVPGFLYIPTDVGKEKQLAYTSTGLKHFTRPGQIAWSLTPIVGLKGFLWFQNALHANFISWIGNDLNRYQVGDGAQDDF